jgi:asparagine synthase (glutamine-hydrolysing)
MGGICGIVRALGAGSALKEISLMTAVMGYRGPDGVRHWSDGNVALGHCLLRTTGEAASESQPLSNEEGWLVLVMDGTIWNNAELRRRLRGKGAVFRNTTDSELVLRCFEVWGRACLEYIDGDFALAVYDRRSGEVVCARDRIGMRPLHWHHSPGCGFCFASDPEALLALSAMPQQIDETRIADCLVWGLEGAGQESTFHAGIRRLPPAHLMVAQEGATVVSRYFTFQLGSGLNLGSDQEYEEAFRAVLSGAVERRMRGRSLTGATLSGGLDSSTLCAFARNVSASSGGSPLRTYSAVAPDPEACLETRMVQAAREMGGLTGRSIALNDLGELNGPLAAWLAGLANPFDRHMTILSAIYASAHRDGCRAVLDAAGADVTLHEGAYLADLIRRGHWLTAISEARGESALLEGYESPQAILLRAARQAVPEPFKRPLRGFLARPRTLQDLIAGSMISVEFARATHVLERSNPPEIATAPGLASAAQRAAEIFSPAITAARERYERTAATHGIEARDPYLDLEVIRFCLSLPPSQLMRGGWAKHIVRRAMSQDLPEPVRWRRLRTHLGVSFSRAMLGSQRTRFLDGAADGMRRLAPYIDRARATSAFDRYAAGQEMSVVDVDDVLTMLTLGNFLARHHGSGRTPPDGRGTRQIAETVSLDSPA